MEIPESVKDKYTDSVKLNKNNSVTVDHIADKLVQRLSNPDRRTYYCKVAWRLSEAQIFNNLETALRGRDPRRYFTWLCEKDMK